MCLTFNFQRSARSLARGFEAAVKHLGLTAPQFTSLSLLAGYGELTVSQIAEKIGTDRTTLTRNLELMRAKGWIAPAASEDLRLRAWGITPEGRVLLEAAMPAWREWQAHLVKTIGPDTARSLLAAMGKL